MHHRTAIFALRLIISLSRRPNLRHNTRIYTRDTDRRKYYMGRSADDVSSVLKPQRRSPLFVICDVTVRFLYARCFIATPIRYDINYIIIYIYTVVYSRVLRIVAKKRELRIYFMCARNVVSSNLYCV